MHRHFTSPSAPECLSYTPGKLSSDVITKWWKAGQLLKHAGSLVCLEHCRRECSLPIQKLGYLHSSSIIYVPYEQNITVIPTKFLPPVTQTLALVPMWLFEFFPSKTWQNMMWPNLLLELFFFMTKIQEIFCKPIFVCFYKLRNTGIYLGQQIWRSKICL